MEDAVYERYVAVEKRNVFEDDTGRGAGTLKGNL